jgi:hypothetical protein
MYLYLASSWRNPYYEDVLALAQGVLGKANVYDFRSAEGFSWRSIDPDFEKWSLDQYSQALDHPLAARGFALDKAALDRSTACLLLGPCGRSAHLELGYVIGRDLPTAIYLPEQQEPELMYLLSGAVLTDVVQLAEWLEALA